MASVAQHQRCRASAFFLVLVLLLITVAPVASATHRASTRLIELPDDLILHPSSFEWSLIDGGIVAWRQGAPPSLVVINPDQPATFTTLIELPEGLSPVGSSTFDISSRIYYQMVNDENDNANLKLLAVTMSDNSLNLINLSLNFTAIQYSRADGFIYGIIGGEAGDNIKLYKFDKEGGSPIHVVSIVASSDAYTKLAYDRYTEEIIGLVVESNCQAHLFRHDRIQSSVELYNVPDYNSNHCDGPYTVEEGDVESSIFLLSGNSSGNVTNWWFSEGNNGVIRFSHNLTNTRSAGSLHSTYWDEAGMIVIHSAETINLSYPFVRNITFIACKCSYKCNASTKNWQTYS